MFIPKGHLKGFFIATGLLGVTVSAGVLASGSLGLFLKRNIPVGDYTRTLDSANQPDLNAGTMTDDVGTIWEYSNAHSYAGGHVSLSHEGYFGIKDTTPYGIPGITSLTANFSTVEHGELWLLKSIDGVEWHEVEILEDGEPTTGANDWRFVRFYFWDDNAGHTNSVEIDSVVINYSCADHNESAAEVIDSATADNTTTVTNFTKSVETTKLSPRSNGGQAVRLTNAYEGSITEQVDHVCRIKFKNNKTYKVSDLVYNKIEFDYYHAEKRDPNKTKRGIPTIQLMNNNSGRGNSQGGTDEEKPLSPFTVEDIGNGWWHLEYFITSLVPTWAKSGWDTPSDPNAIINCVKISDKNIFNQPNSDPAFVIIDNFKIGSNPSNKVGQFNSGTKFAHGNDSHYWFKAAWARTYHSCTFSFSDNTIADHLDIEGCPFYITGKAAGSVVVTINIIVGYNRQQVSISNTITVT